MTDPKDRARIAMWLDSWIALRWRTLVTWIGLTAIVHGIFASYLARWMHNWAMSADKRVPTWITVPSGTWGVMWFAGAAGFFLTWFQPLLLELSWRRGMLWIAAACITIALSDLSDLIAHRSSPYSVWRIAMVLLPGVALIGWRTRWWLILPAAVCFICAFLSLQAVGWHRLAYIGANIPYAVVLLYGTKRLQTDESTSRF